MVRTSGNRGYYVDIFRSNLMDNDYLFHHVGTSLTVTDVEGNKLPDKALEKFDKTWHEGYHWFSNLRKSDYNQNFIASWSMPEDITATFMDDREVRGVKFIGGCSPDYDE